MKKILKYLPLLPLVMMVFISCKKDEKKIYFDGGTNPVLSGEANSGSGEIVLDLTKPDNEAVLLSWTNPDYKFTTGVSSQDVSYAIEIDTVGSDFANAKRVIVSVSKDLKYSITTKKLNDFLTGDDNLKLKTDTKYDLEIRVVSTIGSNEPYTSNVLRFSTTTYLDPSKKPDDWYITGDGTGSGWTNAPPDDQKFTYLGNKQYELLIVFNGPGKFYKFLSKYGDWHPQYSSPTWNGGLLKKALVFAEEIDGIHTPDVAGTYKISVDADALTYTIEKQ